MFGRQFAFVAILMLSAPGVSRAENTPTRQWQSGELRSRKTVPAGRTFLRNQFVYRVNGPTCQYLVVADQPLKLDLYTPMKFSTDRRQIFIMDADGTERKTRILRKISMLRRH